MGTTDARWDWPPPNTPCRKSSSSFFLARHTGKCSCCIGAVATGGQASTGSRLADRSGDVGLRGERHRNGVAQGSCRSDHRFAG